MMDRRLFCGALLSTLAFGGAAQAASDNKVTFHFYGALDCPPCMAFKRNHLANVQAEGQALGFLVEENIIPKTRNVSNVGVYGERDAMLRLAAPQLDLVYPPIFFVSQGGKIQSVHGPNWQDALSEAQRLAGQA